jgi:hypothetical protein
MAFVGAIVICDDIRKEINGKDILIGVYGGDIVVPATPFVLVLAVWFEYSPSRPGKQAITAKASFSGRALLEVRAEIEALEETAGIAMPRLVVEGHTEGDLVIEIVANDDTDTFTKVKRIRLAQAGPTDVSTASQPPS